MHPNRSPLISIKVIEIIQEILDISLSPSQRKLVAEIEKNQDLFCESILKVDEPRNDHTVALESIYYLFFYDFNTRDTKVSLDEKLLTTLKCYLSSSNDSIRIQKTELTSYLLELIETHE